MASPDNLLRIENDGALILASNFWETEHAARGMLYLSINDQVKSTVCQAKLTLP